MIRVDIAENEGLAKLSDGASRLYFHLTPFLSAYGKFSGGPHTIRENIVPLLRWTAKRIQGYLAEINAHTSMRVWKQNGRFYVHDITFFQNQDIREDRRGRDTLPTYPGSNAMKTSASPFSLPEYVLDPLPPEVEVEVKDIEEVEVQVRSGSGNGGGGLLAPSPTAPVVTPYKGEGGKGACKELTEGVTAFLARLSPSSRETISDQIQDYRTGAITRDEAIDTVMRLRIPRHDAEALFPDKATR
jgi:hypothetical protein